MRTLLVCREGAPLFTEVTAGPIRAFFTRCEGISDPMSYRIMEREDGKPDEDITERFAETWGALFRFGDGIVPAEVLSGFPEFVRHHAVHLLMDRWAREIGAPVETPKALERAS